MAVLLDTVVRSTEVYPCHVIEVYCAILHGSSITARQRQRSCVWRFIGIDRFKVSKS